MAKLLARANQGISTVHTENLHWPASAANKLTFIPIGANVPASNLAFTPNGAHKPVGIFCISSEKYRQRETAEILYVAEKAKTQVPSLHLEIFGRGTLEAAPLLEEPLRKLGVTFRLRGVLSADEISRTLSGLDVFLCVRGELQPNRGSALAAIACGVPLVAFGERGRYKELDAAGIEFVPWGSLDTLAAATIRVLTDASLWQELHKKNRRAQAEYFSWDVIAGQYAALLCSHETQSI
jgi:glycosyltransferase involved in cell wall biosynthesis